MNRVPPGVQEEDPNTQIQDPKKLQNPNSNESRNPEYPGLICGVPGMGEGAESALDVWSLVFIWNLDLGVWCFYKLRREARLSSLFPR